MKPLQPELAAPYMPQPNLGPKTLEYICDLLTTYLRDVREQYLWRAVALPRGLRDVVAPFFRKELFDTAGFAQADPPLSNPDFYPKLRAMGVKNLVDFTNVSAVTFMDTIVYQEKLTPRMVFHELVHLEQYRQLGEHKFIRQYVHGFFKSGTYEQIPLEVEAFALDSLFQADPHRVFSVEDEVNDFIHKYVV